MSISFNPNEMDYPSWLTLSGFIMTILVFFMNTILNKLSSNDKNIEGYYIGAYTFHGIRYYTILGITISILIFFVIGGILCFIYNIEHLGAVIVTIVLFILSIFSLLFLLVESIKAYSMPKEVVNKMVQHYHPGINLD